MAEMITIQIGSFANHVGSHFWNLQDEALGCSQQPDWSSLASTVNSEAVCSWSEDRHGDTSYCPRAVVVDLSGSLGGVTFSPDASNAAATAAATAAQAGIWAGAVEMHHLGQSAKSRYRQQLEAAGHIELADADDEEALEAQQQALEAAAAELHAAHSTPKYWTDYLQVDLQHDSVLTLSGAWQGQPGWEGWGPSGSSSSAVRDCVEATVDRVRWWAEQSDSLQGLQVFADDLGGWGGICHAVLQELRDQYPTQPLLCFALRQQHHQLAQAADSRPGAAACATRWLLSNSLSLAEVPQLASLYVPLTAAAAAGPPHLAAGSNKFQAAAVLAAAIDTMTLPLRCTGSRSVAGEVIGATDLHSLVHLLSGPAANLAAGSLLMPVDKLAASNGGGGSSGSDGRQQQQQLLCSSSSGSLSLSDLGSSGYCLTPGVSLTVDCCLAESLSLRGASTSTHPGVLASTGAAKQALDALLLQRQHQAIRPRCVVHSCVSPMPVAAPLSFPSSLLLAAVGAATSRASGSSPVGTASAVVVSAAGAAAAAGRGGVGVARPYLVRSAKAAALQAPGAFSRLTASSGFEQLLGSAARDLQRLAATAAGRACLEDWGYAASDVEELREELLQSAGKYATELDV